MVIERKKKCLGGHCIGQSETDGYSSDMLVILSVSKEKGKIVYTLSMVFVVFQMQAISWVIIVVGSSRVSKKSLGPACLHHNAYEL